jgi:hypothetical protein
MFKYPDRVHGELPGKGWSGLLAAGWAGTWSSISTGTRDRYLTFHSIARLSRGALCTASPPGLVCSKRGYRWNQWIRVMRLEGWMRSRFQTSSFVPSLRPAVRARLMTMTRVDVIGTRVTAQLPVAKGGNQFVVFL